MVYERESLARDRDCASLVGSRALCAMKHVGMNAASDALMTQTLIGAVGGLVMVMPDGPGRLCAF